MKADPYHMQCEHNEGFCDDDTKCVGCDHADPVALAEALGPQVQILRSAVAFYSEEKHYLNGRGVEQTSNKVVMDRGSLARLAMARCAGK